MPKGTPDSFSEMAMSLIFAVTALPSGAGILSNSTSDSADGVVAGPSSVSRSIFANIKMAEAQEPPETELMASMLGNRPRSLKARKLPKAADRARDPPPETQSAVTTGTPGNLGCVAWIGTTSARMRPMDL